MKLIKSWFAFYHHQELAVLNNVSGNSLAIQWLGLCASIAGVTGSLSLIGELRFGGAAKKPQNKQTKNNVSDEILPPPGMIAATAPAFGCLGCSMWSPYLRWIVSACFPSVVLFFKYAAFHRSWHWDDVGGLRWVRLFMYCYYNNWIFRNSNS